MKAVYDAWASQNTPKITTLLESQLRLKSLTEEHKKMATKIANLTETIEEVGYESQANINDYYDNKKRLLQLENCIGHLKFTEAEKEYNLSKEVSELDNEIMQLETQTALAYFNELKTVEDLLKDTDTQIDRHDTFQQALTKLTSTTQIISAYPHYLEVQATDAKLKPLIMEASNLDASINQIITMTAQLNDAKTFEEQIGTFRTLLEQRNTMIGKLSEAYKKYTSWLYPQKVKPAIENAVNEVLNSIALPRPIALEGEWDANFIWYVRDGNSRPPYEKCSGAQRFFLGLAIRIALGRLGSSNMINDQIFIDEGFTACDAETMDRVPILLNNLLKDSNKLNAVFMVSHLEQLKSAATTAIPIVRGALSSRLTVGERQVMPKGFTSDQSSPIVAKKPRGRPKKNEQVIEVAE
jgi:DNA repair exonuclease SbcCD ATPase subunit